MPNWAYTDYYCVGDKEQLKQLHSVMEELQNMESPGLIENGFGATWLGNLVTKLGGDWNTIGCRGSWSNLFLEEDGTVSFFVESAWDEPYEVRDFIEKKFPGIRIYYQTEEEGNGVYKTNDDTGEYFPVRYCLWTDEEGTNTYPLDELIETVEEITGAKNLKTLDDCRKALEAYSSDNSDFEYTLYDFSTVN